MVLVLNKLIDNLFKLSYLLTSTILLFFNYFHSLNSDGQHDHCGLCSSPGELFINLN